MLASQRRYPRVPTQQRCWCEGDRVTLFAQMGNLSVGGAFVRTYAPLPEGTRARLRFGLQGGPEVETYATVVWRRSTGDVAPAGMGLRFDPLPESTAEALQRYVDALAEEGGEA